MLQEVVILYILDEWFLGEIKPILNFLFCEKKGFCISQKLILLL